MPTRKFTLIDLVVALVLLALGMTPRVAERPRGSAERQTLARCFSFSIAPAKGEPHVQ